VPDRFRAAEVPLSALAPEHALRRLELQIVRRLEGFLHGEHLGLLPGPGTDLAEARYYLPGEDDVRRMDWAVSARTTIPHVRDVIADRELETWVVVDLSESMRFGTAAMEKRDLAVAAVATMGLLTFRVGDRFGGYVLRQGSLRRWPARSGRLALFGLLRSLLSDSSSQEPSVTVSLASAITTVARAQRKRGLRVVVSDFLDASDGSGNLDSAPAWERSMRELAARHQVIAVEILDPRELDIPNVGTVLLRDAESGEVRELNTGSRKLRERYAAAARLQRERTARAFRRAGVAHLVLRTDRDWVADTARFALKHRRVAARLHAPPPGATR
jgi:uncharacterized protein (DUF58 family)